ncbi:MAG: YeeE/YedE thiosulfate transporter family protein [Roseateles sp.]|uniref:YeeE/YedE thiosulfate transporter family protein n=1 Tax=Roseateles sp. TaxID=1971397 RepID=UPI0040360F1D
MAEMNEGTRNLLGLATGVLFGALLQRGGVARTRTKVGQQKGEEARVAKTMGTAVAVGALGHRWLHQRGLATDEPKPLNPVGLVGGAVLFGAGMALSGYCPGTAAAAAGSGRREGLWAMAGMLAAATAFVASYPRLKQALEAGSLGRVTAAKGTSARLATPPLNVKVRPREAAGQAMR